MTTLILLDELLAPLAPAHNAVELEAPELEREDGAPWPARQPAYGGRPTLDDVLASTWEGLAAARPVPCPVCAGTMTSRYGAGPAPVAARCTDCGSELS